MATPDMEVIKDIPGYKVILKAVLKSQIQQLVEQLASTTEEESVILTASVADGTLCHLGSDSGKVFLEDHEDIKSQFLGFCLKRHHRKKQEQERREAQEREEALARSMQAVTPPRYDGMGNRMGFMPQRSPRYTSPRQQGPHPVAMSRAPSGGRMRLPGNRHQPYSMTRPARTPLNFDQQGRSPGQGPGPGPGPMGVLVRSNKIDGQVIKIEPEDEDDRTDQGASENTTIQTPIVQTPTDLSTNISESSQPSSPSVKPSTPSQTQGPSASDNEDAKSESSASTIPNDASDLKLTDSAPTGGLSLDSDLSNIISASSDSNIQQPSTSQDSTSELGTTEGLDPNVSVKLEAGGDSEMDLEITGVELGQSTVQEPMSSQEWMANVQNVMQGATGSSADMAGQQGYITTVTDVKVKKEIKTEASTAEELINQEDTKAEPGVETDLSVEEAIVTAKPKLKIKVGRKSKNVKKRKLKKDVKGKGKIGIVFKKKACEEEKPSKQFSEICHVCGKLYRSETGLKYHVREHIGIYKYTCDQCPKKFNFKNAFLAHQQVHTGVNIYRCDMCSKSFHNKSNLGRHSKICTENLSFKIFTCDKCGKCFKSKSYLNDHIKRHALTGGGNKSYHCPKCNSSYFHRTSLYRHFQKTGHNI